MRNVRAWLLKISQRCKLFINRTGGNPLTFVIFQLFAILVTVIIDNVRIYAILVC